MKPNRKWTGTTVLAYEFGAKPLLTLEKLLLFWYPLAPTNGPQNPVILKFRYSWEARAWRPIMKEITQLLHEWRGGSHEAENELFTLVMPKLRRLAQHLMLGEKPGQSMQATELVDQVYLGMVSSKDRDWQNRGHFFALAARAMRHHLIDRARRPQADRVSMETLQNVLPSESGKLDLAVTVDRLLNEMQTVKPEWCRVVEVKYFLGLTDDEAAAILGMPLRTLQRAWRDARQWLFQKMEPASATSNR